MLLKMPAFCHLFSQKGQRLFAAQNVRLLVEPKLTTMKALVFHTPKNVSVDTVPDPEIKEPTDLILKVTSTAICGSDLHIYNGMFPQARNMVLGHEFMGEVVETGSQVSKWKKGDRLIIPFPIACGSCWFCNHAMSTHCEHSNPEFYGPEGDMLKGKGAALFGYTDLYGGYDGGQAEYVRVPYADFSPRRAPEGFTDDQVLFLTDILPTGYTAIDWANLKGGEVVAIFGAGPVGLMAAKVAWIKGASRVFVIDIEGYRLETARRTTNAEVIDASKDDPAEILRQMTNGRGADVCVDAVGMEAHRTILDKALTVVRGEVGTIDVLKTCFEAVRRGGIVTVVGVYGTMYDNFPLHRFFDKGLIMRAGQAPVVNYIDELIELVTSGRVVLDDIITHRLPLTEAAHGYEIFNEKKDNCVKVVLKPDMVSSK